MGRPRIPRSLACFVQALEGQEVLLETRYDLLVRGSLDQVDEHMNLTLSQVTVDKMADGSKQEMPFMHVRGRVIRYIHVPSDVKPHTAIEDHRKRIGETRQIHARQAAQSSKQLYKGDGPQTDSAVF